MSTNIGGQDFEAVPVTVVPPEPELFTLAGAVAGPVVSGVTITLQGTSSGSMTTSAGGSYSFIDLPEGVYVITPSLAGHTFNPPQLIVNLTQNTTGQNFTSVPPVVPDTYNVSGKITGALVQGIKIDLSGAAAAQTFTDVNGDYIFIDLSAGTYVLVPTEEGYAFEPPFRIVTLSNA